MSEQTPKLSLPLIQGAQAQKHVTHNEAIELLDMLTQLTVEEVGTTTPPGSANEGQSWVVGSGATGAWAGHDDDLASWRGGGWLFVAPKGGWRAWSKQDDNLSVYFDGMWRDLPGAAPDFDNLAGVGINATSDATNKLAVAADASLFSHDGAGHQLKLNKAAVTDTASLLYQSNWSGRAEMGLAGNDDFSVKVSADGTTFTEALRVEAATGHVEMPTARVRQIMPYHYRMYCYSDHRWTGLTANGAALNASQTLGTGTEPNQDWDAKGVFLTAGSVIHGLRLAGNFTSSEVTDVDLRICFQHGPWNSSWNTNAETTRVVLASLDAAGLTGGTDMQRLDVPLAYTAPADGYFQIIMRPVTTAVLTATRYFQSAGALDVSCARL